VMARPSANIHTKKADVENKDSNVINLNPAVALCIHVQPPDLGS